MSVILYQEKVGEVMKYVLYPYTEELNFYVNNIRKLRAGIESIIVVKLKSVKIETKLEQGIEISENYETALQRADGVLLLEGNVYRDMLSKIMCAIGRVKKIVCCHTLLEHDLQKIIFMCNRSNTEFEYLGRKDSPYELLTKRRDPYVVLGDVMIGISSLTKGIVTDDALIGLSICLSNMGYKVLSLVTSRNLCGCGFQYFPYWELCEDAVDYDDLVLQLNRYVNWVQMKERADIILVQFPDEGIMQWSAKLAYSFGVNAFILSQAIPIDYNVLFAPIGILDVEEYRNLAESIHKRLGFGIDAVCVEPKVMDQSESKILSKMVYKKIGGEFVLSDEMKICGEIVFAEKYRMEDYRMISQNIVDKLS